MNKYNKRRTNMTRIVCLVIAGAMIISVIASGMLMFL